MNALDAAASAHPDARALDDGRRQWTWSQLRDEALPLAAALRSRHGLQSGDVVATCLPATAEHVLLLHAAWYAGLTVAPLHAGLPEAELRARLAHLSPALLVAGDALPPGRTAVSMNELTDASRSAPAAETATALSAEPGNSDALCSILYTSGSSGAPHAVAHGWRQHRAAASAAHANIPLGAGDCWQCVIPLHHIGGLAILTRALFSGCAVRLHDGFDVDEVAAALRTDGVTVSSLVPTMLHRLLEADDALRGDALPPLRAVLLGGAGAPDGLWQRIRARDLPVVGTYGMTESCAQVATADPLRWREEAGTAGRSLPGVQMDIRDAEGRRCGSGDEGEIYLRGPMIADGYFRDPNATATAFKADWLATGDIGVLDSEGRLRVLARREDMILSGGEKVYPAAVEAVLLRHADVTDAAVVGIEDEEWGQRVAAAVVLRTDTDINEVEAFCRAELAAYQLPRIWRVLDALPRTASGKILRGKLQEMFRA